MSRRVCLLPGDGIGPEVVGAARRVLAALDLGLAFDDAAIGFEEFQRTGAALPAESLARARAADACLLGAVGSPLAPTPGYRSAVVQLRRELDLFACVRRVTSPPMAGARQGVDLVLVRENTEGLYAGREVSDGNRAVAERVVTRAATERITRFAIDLVRREGRRRVTLVHKANVLRETCGLFRTVALAALTEAGVEHDELLVDAAAYELARAPERFDVLLTTNLFGDILSDLAAVFGGGLGVAASANVGAAHAVFEPVHGSAPALAGTGRANPLACIRAAAELLAHLGEDAAAQRVHSAIGCVLAHGPHTPDLGGVADLDAITEAVLDSVTDPIPVM